MLRALGIVAERLLLSNYRLAAGAHRGGGQGESG